VAPIQTTASPTRSTAPPLRSSPSPARTAAVAQAKETAFIAGRAAVLVFVVVAALLFASEVFWGTLR
jgi:hypothetical protein